MAVSGRAPWPAKSSQDVANFWKTNAPTGICKGILSGADDIMKVTGHASPKMLKKYIEADSLEVVEKLTDKYKNFR